MPSKRRGVRNGTAQSGKPLANIAAVAAAQQRQANIQQQQQQQQHNQHNKHRAGAGGNSNSSSSSAMDHHQQQCSTDGGECANDNNDSAPLTLKQQQQLERNQFLVALTKDQLRVECRKRGQKTNGNKTELLQRLGFKMNVGNNTTAAAQSSAATGSTVPASHQNGSAGNGSGDSAAAAKTKARAAERERERAEREQLVLWRHPLCTLSYSCQEAAVLLMQYWQKLSQHQYLIMTLVALAATVPALYSVDGWHRPLLEIARHNIWFVMYWVGLGVVSSVGLGTGLHTFLLYLGPHIASVTLAAYECNSLDFPRPPYPDEIICPTAERGANIPTLWAIMSKVRLEAFLWGAGTALGELPPYFMAKAARLSGYDPEDDDDLKEFEELQKKREHGDHLSLLERAKVSMERVVERIGFLGILACASVPNPLFDLAGITCGHFLVPFWTFFGATLIGKAIIKMHIQKVFVIIAFNESLIERVMDLLGAIPVLGARAQVPLKSFLQNQKNRLHGSTVAKADSGNVLAKCFELFVGAMVFYFVVSIVNSLAQSYHKRLHKKKPVAVAAGGGAKNRRD